MSARMITVPEELFTEISEEANRTGLDAQQWVTKLLMRHVELKRETEAYFRERASRASGRSLSEMIAQAPDVPPMPGDELPEGWSPDELR